MIKIGFVGKNIGPTTFGINKAYLEFAHYIGSSYGGVMPIIISPTSDDIIPVDLLIVPGGADVLDENSKPSLFNTNPDLMLEYFDRVHLKNYISKNIPIFGICRGFQAINIFFGGNLHNELFSHPFSKSDNRSERVHKITLTNNGKEYFGELKPFEVNSLHHQGIMKLGNGLIALGESYHKDCSNVVETFIHSTLRIAGVQWHPEEIYCDFSKTLIDIIEDRNISNEDVKEYINNLLFLNEIK